MDTDKKEILICVHLCLSVVNFLSDLNLEANIDRTSRMRQPPDGY